MLLSNFLIPASALVFGKSLSYSSNQLEVLVPFAYVEHKISANIMHSQRW